MSWLPELDASILDRVAKMEPSAGDGDLPAGSTPFFSGGRHSAVPNLADEADLPIGSPMTISRKLLQPVLLDTIRSLRTRSALGLAGSGAAALPPGMTPGQPLLTPAPAKAAGMPSRALGGEAESHPAKAAGELRREPAESGACEQAALPEQDRYSVKRLLPCPVCILHI